MSIIERFIKRIKDKQNEDFVPSFKVGDIIQNDSVKCVAEVLKVFWSKRNDPTGEHAQYRLKYFKNPAAQKVVGSDVGLHGSYTRSKYIRKIDPYYELVPEEVAQLLYGSRVTEAKNERTKVSFEQK